MILLVGATGELGGRIARRLLARGEDLRILVRPGSSYHTLIEAGAEAVSGDVKDRDSLDRAMKGVDVVITTANSAGRGGDDTVDTVEIAGNRNLIDAARDAHVRQFVFISALGAADDSPVDFLRGKGLAEKHLRESGIPYTILRPNVFMEVWIPMLVGMPLSAGRPVTLLGEGRRRHSFVSIDDVADFAVASVGNPGAINQEIAIGGPVAISWREVVDATGRVTGRDIPLQTLPLDAQIPGLPPVVSGLAASFDAFDSPIEMSETAARFGVSLTTVEDFLQRTFHSHG